MIHLLSIKNINKTHMWIPYPCIYTRWYQHQLWVELQMRWNKQHILWERVSVPGVRNNCILNKWNCFWCRDRHQNWRVDTNIHLFLLSQIIQQCPHNKGRKYGEKEQGSHCFAMSIEWQTIIAALFFIPYSSLIWRCCSKSYKVLQRQRMTINNKPFVINKVFYGKISTSKCSKFVKINAHKQST